MARSRPPRRMRIGVVDTARGTGGGAIYLDYVVRALADRHVVRRYRGNLPVGPYRPGILGRTFAVTCLGSVDIWVLSANPVAAYALPAVQGPAVGLFHHYDAATEHAPRFGKWFTERMWSGFRRCERVVVVAEYWQRYLASLGIDNTVLIHNAFDVDGFLFSSTEVEDAKKRHALMGKPIIYIGNSRPHKGTEEVWQALRTIDAHFVTSGPGLLNLPCKNIDGSYETYRRLLAASDVVVTMSRFDEGWNRTAHEAMLAGTPVVGSGKGGMEELLSNGGQIVCRSFEELKGYVLQAIEERAQLGDRGRAFARQFGFEQFRSRWLGLVEELQDGLRK